MLDKRQMKEVFIQNRDFYVSFDLTNSERGKYFIIL